MHSPPLAVPLPRFPTPLDMERIERRRDEARFAAAIDVTPRRAPPPPAMGGTR